MTASRVVFDTWAWWEVLQQSRAGEALARRYLEAPGCQVLTSALSLGELSAKLASQGSEASIPGMVAAIRHASLVVDVSADLAVEGGRLRSHLRQRSPTASLADGIVLSTARRNSARLISDDRAFSGEPDVRAA